MPDRETPELVELSEKIAKEIERASSLLEIPECALVASAVSMWLKQRRIEILEKSYGPRLDTILHVLEFSHGFTAEEYRYLGMPNRPGLAAAALDPPFNGEDMPLTDVGPYYPLELARQRLAKAGMTLRLQVMRGDAVDDLFAPPLLTAS